MTISALLFDLDGTVYRGADPIPGAAAFIGSLTLPYLFVTNRASRTPDTVARQLVQMGIACEAGHVLTSGEATASYLGSGASAWCIGEQGLRVALAEAGVRVIGDDEQTTPDAVIVSHDSSFTYDALVRALRHIERGARFIATNDDRVITVEDGNVPEAGPLVAAVHCATGKAPEMVGKPHPGIMHAAFSRLDVPAAQCVIVGDNLDTDILAGHNAGIRSVLILTGVSTRADADRCAKRPTWVVEDYAGLAELLA